MTLKQHYEDFEPKVSAKLEYNFMKNEKTCKIDTGDVDLFIDFDAMTCVIRGRTTNMIRQLMKEVGNYGIYSIKL